jgi:hypothetical protein
MPTGYTADIVDGKISTFKEFAKKCMRAFGATIHMRDEPLEKEYKKRTPDDYYYSRVQETESKLVKALKAPDKFFIDMEMDRLKSHYSYHKKKIEERKGTYERLASILEETENWNPPTEEHVGIKDFMIQQLEETIKYDGDTSYDEDELDEIVRQMESPIDVKRIKEDYIESLNEDLESAKKRLDEELKRCEDSDEWVSKFLKSLE